jgi:hypothetical protein
MEEPNTRSPFAGIEPQVRHVAFLDVLGFSAKVLADFHDTVSLYAELVRGWQIQNHVFPQVRLTI